MSSQVKSTKSEKHLMHILKSTVNHHPNFVLFLGAGASIESGVKSGAEMIEEWREIYTRVHAKGDSKVIEKQSWHNTTIEYSTLFESIYDQPSLRREYIENCLENSNPSWGYIYLVELLKEKVFNTVFTTNFDDLLNEACYLYSKDVRPIVCAHDSSIRSVRITTKRPKIIKLHGDFLFDSIKNTVRELESLEDNMREKLKQYANEFGMIVIGYGGNDRSIMDMLDALLRNDSSFPHGIYWCVRNGTKLNDQVESLRRFNKFHIVEIGGFNSFFSELYNELYATPHPFFANPYKFASDRLVKLCESLRAPSVRSALKSTLYNDINTLVDSSKSPMKVEELSMPYQILAWVALGKNDPDKAAEYITNDLEKQVTKEGVAVAIATLKSKWTDSLADKLIESLEQRKFGKLFSPPHVMRAALELIHLGKFDHAQKVLNAIEAIYQYIGGESNQYFQINKAQVFRHKKTAIPDDLVTQIKDIAANSSDNLAKFGAHLILEDFDSAKEQLLQYTNSSVQNKDSASIHEIIDWPILKLFPSDYIQSILRHPSISQHLNYSDISSDHKSGQDHNPETKQSTRGGKEVKENQQGQGSEKGTLQKDKRGQEPRKAGR